MFIITVIQDKMKTRKRIFAPLTLLASVKAERVRSAKNMIRQMSGTDISIYKNFIPEKNSATLKI